jgi:hypothetical protein
VTTEDSKHAAGFDLPQTNGVIDAPACNDSSQRVIGDRPHRIMVPPEHPNFLRASAK